MTNREFYEKVAKISENKEMVDFANEAIEKLDARNKKRASKMSKTAIANAPLKEAILELLANGNDWLASTIAVKLNISTQKASALCRQLVEEGKITDELVSIPKTGKRKVYNLSAQESEEVDEEVDEEIDEEVDED